jgi:Trk-type K+ transport system membrane component
MLIQRNVALSIVAIALLLTMESPPEAFRPEQLAAYTTSTLGELGLTVGTVKTHVKKGFLPSWAPLIALRL